MMCLCGGLVMDNARIMLFAVVLTVYMLAEDAQDTEFQRIYHAFRHHLRDSPLSLQKLDELLYAHVNASIIINRRRRWDFPGSFHFVSTIVSTIGYGSTTPQTTAGKAVVILYGFFGCSGGILFFNLFLERIITFLAWILRHIRRSWHICRLRRRLRKTTLASRRVSKSANNQKRLSLPDILDDDDDHVNLDQWKPSVYEVMLILSAISCIITCCAAALYASLEGWNYFDALYFAFISFTTIGFGDFVSMQKPSYPHEHWYIFANFIFLVVGCCCIYSLLNVTSIVIKQGLNYVIHKLQYGNRDLAAPYLPRRQSSISSVHYSKRRSTTRFVGRDSIKVEDNSETPRRMSGELISMKDFLSANKVSLAIMQKQLYDAAQKQRDGGSLTATPNHQILKPDPIGPLAIVSEIFENKSTINR